ncbi:MAG: glycosyltransferase family 39 protein [Cyanobacteria bacterium SZAS LIN-2]|nr:glycosyltransferase family 39 protein [Cyanobacteria bacterium SZAS LIN-2]
MLAPSTTQPVKHSIEKAHITWASTKTQMFFACLLITVSVWVAYGSSLSLGFLLDDYLHLDYCARALAGDATPLLNNLTSNWGGSDIMKSYRPTVSFSIFIDYLLYHTHAAGYHLTNIFTFTVCSILVAFVTHDIANRLGSRTPSLIALWAGLLFTVYPLHVESVAWIIGRVDTLATMFYLASLFCFLRLQLVNEKKYLVASLIFFVLSLTSKEIAVSLPLAIGLAACLPQTPERRSAVFRLKSALIATLPYLLLLGGYAVFRQALLGTAVGGYGGSGLTDIFHSLKIFADKESLTKIFIPVSEEYQPVRAFAQACLAPLIVAAAAFISRQLTMIARARYSWSALTAPLGSIIWLALALVPAFQIWHIYPNLVGSRLFFLSSAGLCITIALLALPTVEPLPRKAFSFFSTLSILALTALYLTWFSILTINLGAWQSASKLLSTFETELRTAAQNAPAEGHLVILNLPQDYKGAGMLGRKLYLDIANRPPFLGQDLSKRLAVLEPKITGSRDFIWPHELTAVLQTPGDKTFIWSNKSATLMPFAAEQKPGDVPAAPGSELGRTLTAKLAALPTLQAGQWQAVERGKPFLRKYDQYSELDLAHAPTVGNHKNGNKNGGADQAMTIWLDGAGSEINPREAQNWMLSLDVLDEHGLGMVSRCQALWRDCKSGEVLGSATAYMARHRGQYLFYLGRYRSYLLAPGRVQLGLRFDLSDGPLRIKPESLSLGGDSLYVPTLKMGPGGTITWDVAPILQGDKSKTFDSAKLFVTAGNTTIDPAGEYDLYQPAVLEKAVPARSFDLKAATAGSIALSEVDKALGQEGGGKKSLYQIVVVATDKSGKLVSLPSQPITINP